MPSSQNANKVSALTGRTFMQKCPQRKTLSATATYADGLRQLQTVNQMYDDCALKHNTLVDAIETKEKITN